MELRYPILIIIVILGIILSFLIAKKKHIKYSIGSKIANTEYLKNSDYFKEKMKEFNLLKKTIYLVLTIAIITSSILIARLAKVETVNLDQYNRDIFLCMDVSASVDELNVELVENLKKTVKQLNGERFGISIFNTSSVSLVPLTDDYDYINSVLDQIKKSIEANNVNNFGDTVDDDFYYIRNYIVSGTLEGGDVRGSSLIGDGLASCVYSFSNLEEERSRIIILSTDNDLAGKPLVTLDKAAQISKSKGIKVFGIGTKIMDSSDRTGFKSAVEKTGGKFYEHSNSTVNSIVSDIESTSKSLLQGQIETKKIDIPQIPFIILIASIFGFIIISKKVAK